MTPVFASIVNRPPSSLTSVMGCAVSRVVPAESITVRAVPLMSKLPNGSVTVARTQTVAPGAWLVATLPPGHAAV